MQWINNFRLVRSGFLKSNHLRAKLRHLFEDSVDDPIYTTNLSNMSLQTNAALIEIVVAKAKEHFKKENIGDLTVLDWGSGKGIVSAGLKEAGFNTIPAEVVGYPHTKLSNTAGQRVVELKDDIVLPLKDTSVDIIVAFGVLEHVKYDQDSLKELNRVLKDDGMLCIFHLPNKYGWLHKVADLKGIEYHDRRYTKRELNFMLARAGFRADVMWRRQWVPKSTIDYSRYEAAEKIDHYVSMLTPVNLVASSIECVAVKNTCYRQDS